MGGILQVDTIQNNNATTLITQTNSTTLTFGVSGQNIVIPSGVTFNTASATVTLPTTIKVDTIQNTNSSTLITQTNSTTITVGATGQTIALPSQSISYAAISNAVNFRNRIINGNMVLDQRSSGSAVTVNSAARIYALDKFFGYGQATDGAFTIQQSSTAPTGFVNSAIITTTTADASVGASQFYLLGQSIEGVNISDLSWGTANAKTVTLSFWVRSSLTGQFGGSLTNSGNARSYPFSYTISAANTFEKKSITITGDTSGTWLTNTSIGINVWWDLGCGSSNIGTAGAWATAGYYGATGDTKLISTNGATFYITGVQLEAGTSASDFELLPYDINLFRAKRYFQSTGNVPLSAYATVGCLGFVYQVEMRTTPTITFNYSGTANRVYNIEVGTTSDLVSTVIIANAYCLNHFYAFTPTNWAVAKGTGFNTAFKLDADFS